ncbi:MAG: hypothetical protein AAF267_20900 [Deinococcota bacterium]
MSKFSERHGFKTSIIQIESMDKKLRVSLWNLMLLNIKARIPYDTENCHRFEKEFFVDYLRVPYDEVESGKGFEQLLSELKYCILNKPWYEVCDVVEFIASSVVFDYLAEDFNNILQREASGYRLINGQLTNIYEKNEVEMLQEALQDGQFVGVSKHLKRALELYTDREAPDYRNSIKESISAVESMVRTITSEPKASLSKALKVIDDASGLHKALKEGFAKLYGYTSDEDGIRHAMMNEPNITAADAKYFLLSCTSFVNYLKEKMPQT